nr:hypothetical protein SEVIR_9G438150v2 [Setaria viridis]
MFGCVCGEIGIDLSSPSLQPAEQEGEQPCAGPRRWPALHPALRAHPPCGSVRKEKEKGVAVVRKRRGMRPQPARERWKGRRLRGRRGGGQEATAARKRRGPRTRGSLTLAPDEREDRWGISSAGCRR